MRIQFTLFYSLVLHLPITLTLPFDSWKSEVFRNLATNYPTAKYAYYYETFDPAFASFIVGLKDEFSLRINFISSSELKILDSRSFNFYWYNKFCRLILNENSTVIKNTPAFIMLVDNFQLLQKINDLAYCLNKNHLVIVFDSPYSSQLKLNSKVFSTTFAIWITNDDYIYISYLDDDLKTTKLTTVKKHNITGSIIDASSLKVEVLTINTQRCYCKNGSVMLRVGNRTKPLYVFDKNAEANELLFDNFFDVYSQNIFLSLADSLKFSFTTIPSKDNFIGSKEESEWNGLIGMLLRNEIDIAISPIAVVSDRYNDVDLIKPFFREKFGMLMYKSYELEDSLFDIFLPFSKTLWLCCFGAIFTSACILHCLYKFDLLYSNFFSFRQSNSENKYHSLDFSFLKSLCFTFGKFFSQNLDYETQHIPSRIVVLIWWLFAITIMTSFTASLTASFTTSKPEGSVNTLAELADSSKHVAIIFKDSSADAYFKTSNDEIHRKIYKKALKSINKNYNGKTVLELMKNDKHVFIGEYSLLKYYASVYCDLALGKETFGQVEFAFALQKHSPFKDRISDHVIRLIEGGITQQLFEQKINENEISICDEQSISATELKTFYGIYFVVVVATILSLAILLLEILIHKICYKNSKDIPKPRFRKKILYRKDSDYVDFPIANNDLSRAF